MTDDLLEMLDPEATGMTATFSRWTTVTLGNDTHLALHTVRRTPEGDATHVLEVYREPIGLGWFRLSKRGALKIIERMTDQTTWVGSGATMQEALEDVKGKP